MGFFGEVHSLEVNYFLFPFIMKRAHYFYKGPILTNMGLLHKTPSRIIRGVEGRIR